MTKKEVKKLIKEFEKAHNHYSISQGGYWKPNWRKVLKYADIKRGYWYWRGYRLADLSRL